MMALFRWTRTRPSWTTSTWAGCSTWLRRTPSTSGRQQVFVLHFTTFQGVHVELALYVESSAQDRRHHRSRLLQAWLPSGFGERSCFVIRSWSWKLPCLPTNSAPRHVKHVVVWNQTFPYNLTFHLNIQMPVDKWTCPFLILNLRIKCLRHNTHLPRDMTSNWAVRKSKIHTTADYVKQTTREPRWEPSWRSPHNSWLAAPCRRTTRRS